MWCSYSIIQKEESNTSSPKMAGTVKPPNLVGSGRTNLRSHSQDSRPLSKGKWHNPFFIGQDFSISILAKPGACLLKGKDEQSQVLCAVMSAELASGDLPETQFAGAKSQVCSHCTSGWPIFGISFPFPSFLPCAVALCHCTADYVRFVLLTPTGTLPRTSDAGTSRADTWPWVSKQGSEPVYLFPNCFKIT